MNYGLRASVTLGALLLAHAAHATEVAVCTDRGRAVIELADAEAPQSVANFLRYVDMGFYSGTVFHRVLPERVVQGGGLDRQLRVRGTLPPVNNESSNGLSNERGTVAAARTADPDSAQAQFFVNLDDNAQLDGGREPGYTVFGRVTEGIEVFDAIGRLPTGPAGPLTADVPTPLVAIKSMARIDEAALAALPTEGREAALKAEIAAAAEAGNAAEALRLIGHYRALCAPDDADVGLTEARMALALEDRRRALLVLAEVLATTDASQPAYETANALYREAAENPASAELLATCAPPAVPALPDARVAAMEEMAASQRQVREFVEGGERYLACLAEIVDDEERSAALRNAAVDEHNRMVAAMEEVAAAFNEQLRIFRARD
jgi:cyclophilin family peptidyl-prolyl cis-trans isomerase